MSEIIVLLKQVGIFMVCAQTVVHFKPQQKYDKYLKLLIGIMVIAQLVSPIFRFLNGNEISLETDRLQEWEQIEFNIDGMLESANFIVDKYTDSEVKTRLNKQTSSQKNETDTENIEYFYQGEQTERERRDTERNETDSKIIKVEEISVGSGRKVE